MTKIAVIIPARMASSRFPGKPLARIHGMMMIEHVYRRAVLSKSANEVAIATCDEEIRQAVEGFGGRAIMTSDKHERGTDRVAEAARSMGADIVVNVQGDEPMLNPAMVDLVVDPLLRDRKLACCNLIEPLPLHDEAAVRQPNAVKVTFDCQLNALYFSRSPIPSFQYKGADYQRYKQLGLYAFTAPFLQRFTELPPTPLEAAESVDMMRLLEHGLPLRVAVSPYRVQSVDTPADLREVERWLQGDALMASYNKPKGASW